MWSENLKRNGTKKVDGNGMVAHLQSLIVFVAFVGVIGYFLYRKTSVKLPFEKSSVTLERGQPETVSPYSIMGFFERKAAREGVSAYGYTVPDTPALGNLDQYVWSRYFASLGLTSEKGKVDLRTQETQR
jgi:hypothetical protein